MEFQDLGSTPAVGALFFLQREVICVKFFTSGAQLNILQNYLVKDLIQKLCWSFIGHEMCELWILSKPLQM